MPRYNVNHNDKWACFSSIVDDFVTPFVSLEEYEQWRTDEYGRSKTDLQHANKMSLEETLNIIREIHGEERISELIYEIENENKVID